MPAARAAVAALVVVLLVALIGTLSDDPAPKPPADTILASWVVTGDVRTPDARSPLVRAEGLWRCQTDGRVELWVSAEGQATLTRPRSPLVAAFRGRTLINRDCDAQHGQRALPPFRARTILPGNSHLNCHVPRSVLVELRDGDVIVRRTGSGDFLLGAAVTERHLEPAAAGSGACAVD
jgi:hypothetical protein